MTRTEKSPVALAAPRALENDRSRNHSHNSQSQSEPQYARRLDRAKFLSVAEVERRYGSSIDVLRQSNPPFPWPVSVGERSESSFALVHCRLGFLPHGRYLDVSLYTGEQFLRAKWLHEVLLFPQSLVRFAGLDHFINSEPPALKRPGYPLRCEFVGAGVTAATRRAAPSRAAHSSFCLRRSPVRH